jgi:hypothetical protein
MSISWKNIDVRWLFLSLLAFVVGGLSFHRATLYADAVPTERTTTTYDASMRMRYHNLSFIRLDKYYTCSYDFMADGVSYRGNGDCTQLSSVDSIKGKLSDTVPVLTAPNITVYYDPSNPSLNSPTEFSARSKAEYRDAILWTSIGTFINLPLIFWVVYVLSKCKGNHRQYVDARGTVIDPDEIGFGSEFGGLPGESKWQAESFSATNDEVVKPADFASSHGLRKLYLDVVKHVHPDHALNEADRALRERLTKEANAAFKRGDDETLRRVLEEYKSVISATC